MLYLLFVGFDVDVGVFDVCGDGVVVINEVCDGVDFKGVICEVLGLLFGLLICFVVCMFDVSVCSLGSSCGDGEVGLFEECEFLGVVVEICLFIGLG